MVKVTINPTTKEVVTASKNPEFGYIRVEEKVSTMENGWLRTESRSAIINGKTADLKALNYVNGQQISGKIVVKESLTASFDGQEPKKAGKDGATITSGGSPVYRNAYFTSDLDAKDELLAMDHVAAKTAVASEVKTNEVPA